jgi:hypothetical protein
LRFKGQLLLPTERGPGLRVDLEVAGHHLAVESVDGELGAWPLEAVRVRRLEGDVFAMTVAGEDLHFIADDAIGFAYSGMPAIEEISGFARSRGRLRGLLSRFGPESPPVPQAQAGSLPDPDDQLPPRVVGPIVDEPVTHGLTPVAAELQMLESEEEGNENDHEDIIDVWALPPSLDPEPVDDPATTPEPEERLETVPTAETPRTEISETTASEDSPSCPGVTSEGLPCRSPILGSSGYCYNHDPDREVEDGYRKALEARERMKRKGTAQLTKVYSRLEKAMREVERGELEPDIAVAMAQIARTMCAILDLDTEGEEGTEDEGGSDLTPRF